MQMDLNFIQLFDIDVQPANRRRLIKLQQQKKMAEDSKHKQQTLKNNHRRKKWLFMVRHLSISSPFHSTLILGVYFVFIVSILALFNDILLHCRHAYID